MAGLAQGLAADGHDEPVLLGQRHELQRRDESPFGMLPADERLGGHDAAGIDVDDRLIVQHELVVGDAPFQICFQLLALDERLVHRRHEYLVGVLAAGLGHVHGDVGVAEQILDRRVVVGDRHSCAGAGHHLAVVDHHRRPHRAGDPLHDAAGVDLVDVAPEQHRELVTAEPGGEVVGPQARLDALRDGHEQQVTGGVALAVVDGLEVVDVDEQHRRPGVVSGLHFAQRALDGLNEEAAVGEAGERVVERLVAQPRLELGQLGQRPFEPAVLEGDAHVVGQRFEEAQILAVEPADFAQAVADQHGADGPRLAPQRRHHGVVDAPLAEVLQEDGAVGKAGVDIDFDRTHNGRIRIRAYGRAQRPLAALGGEQGDLRDLGPEHLPGLAEHGGDGGVELLAAVEDAGRFMKELEVLVLLPLAAVGAVGEHEHGRGDAQQPDGDRVQPEDGDAHEGEAAVGRGHGFGHAEHAEQTAEPPPAFGQRHCAGDGEHADGRGQAGGAERGDPADRADREVVPDDGVEPEKSQAGLHRDLGQVEGRLQR